MKILPIDFILPEAPPPAPKPVFKSKFKRLFERQFSSVLRLPSPASCNCGKDGSAEFELEPSSACLARMVQNFIEGSNEKPQQWCENKKRCNRFNGNCTDNSGDESDSSNSSSSDACDLLKSLVPCLCISERNLLADAARIIDRNMISKRKDGSTRKVVTDGLIFLGYNASICKSKWEKSQSIPAGEYEYIDVIIQGERYIIDIEFRSEFEVARATKAYTAILQTLPSIFVGQSDRLEKIISIVSEAAKQSLNKKGMHFPPWRRADYVKAKWLSPFSRINNNPISITDGGVGIDFGKELPISQKGKDSGEEEVFVLSESEDDDDDDDGFERVKGKGLKIVTGLASLIGDVSR